MRRRTIQMVVALSPVAFGWLAGARTPAPEFTLRIDTPEGRTIVECARGCTLQDFRGGNSTPTEHFWFECKGDAPAGCGATVNGWLKRNYSR